MANQHKNLTDLFTDCANQIRQKKGTTEQIQADQFPAEIAALSGAQPAQSKQVKLTQNGTVTILPDPGKLLSSVVADVNVTAALNLAYEQVTLPESTGGEARILTGNSFIRAHREEEGFFVLLWPDIPSREIGYVTFNYGGNTPVGVSASGPVYCSVTICTSSGNASFARLQTGKVSGTPEGYNSCLVTNADGNLYCYPGSNTKISAGVYHILLCCRT